MATLLERVGDRSLAEAIETLRLNRIRVDETSFLIRDDRFCLVKVLAYAWQWIVEMISSVGRCFEQRVIKPLFYTSPLRRIFPLYASRKDDPTGGLNAFLHFGHMPELLRQEYGSVKFAFLRLPAFKTEVERALGNEVDQYLKRPLIDLLRLEAVRGIFRNHHEITEEVVAHLHIVKEWELFCHDSEATRREGDVLTVHCERFLREFLHVEADHVDVVALFHQVMQGLPFIPSFYGFEVERGTGEITGRYVPPDRHRLLQSARALTQVLAGRSAGNQAAPLARERHARERVQLRTEPKGVIALPFIPGRGEGFEQLKGRYFSPPDSSIHWSEGEHLEMRVVDRYKYFEYYPSEIYFSIPRVGLERRGHQRARLSFHRDHVHVPFQTSLPRRIGSEVEEREYILREFIAFLGDVDTGKYAYYRKEGRQWFECVNAKTRLVSEEEVRMILNERSVLHRFLRV